MPVSQTAIDWVTLLLEYVWKGGYTRVEAQADAEQRWLDEVVEMYEALLLRTAKSWITGYNSNLEGHEYGKMRYNVYNGGGPRYAARLKGAVNSEYEEIDFS